jgi:hypothetical protein
MSHIESLSSSATGGGGSSGSGSGSTTPSSTPAPLVRPGGSILALGPLPASGQVQILSPVSPKSMILSSSLPSAAIPELPPVPFEGTHAWYSSVANVPAVRVVPATNTQPSASIGGPHYRLPSTIRNEDGDIFARGSSFSSLPKIRNEVCRCIVLVTTHA